jgi:hypothetical protein
MTQRPWRVFDRDAEQQRSQSMIGAPPRGEEVLERSR